jgi:MFS transporter, FSR family, fosmidomycin resistance protein
MTQTISVPARRFGELRFVAPICVAHFLSHYYMILLAPLFAFVRADYGVSYTDLALALTAFNVVSAALQTPTGFLVDRVGARVVLIAGVALGATAFAVAGLVHSYVVFIAMFAVAGLGNTVYHPADYSLLSDHTPPARVSQVFSFHTFSVPQWLRLRCLPCRANSAGAALLSALPFSASRCSCS